MMIMMYCGSFIHLNCLALKKSTNVHVGVCLDVGSSLEKRVFQNRKKITLSNLTFKTV